MFSLDGAGIGAVKRTFIFNGPRRARPATGCSGGTGNNTPRC